MNIVFVLIESILAFILFWIVSSSMIEKRNISRAIPFLLIVLSLIVNIVIYAFDLELSHFYTAGQFFFLLLVFVVGINIWRDSK